MPRFTVQILSHYKSCYFVVLRRPPFPYCCYSSCILLSRYGKQCLSGFLGYFLCNQSIERLVSKSQRNWQYLVDHCIKVRRDCIFLNITAGFQSWLRNSVSQIPLTYREFRCPVPIMSLETPPNICAMVSAHLGVLALPQWADVHCNWQQFIDLWRENLAFCLASLVKTEIFSKIDHKKFAYFFFSYE